AEPLPSATAPASDAAVSPEETADAAASASQAAKKVSTIVYYQDNYGYLVPVMCSVPLQDGIAKATLGMMVQSADNDMQAARLGFRTVLPEGTDIDLDISGGLARIDLGPEVLHMADAAAETNMVNAVVQALTEFDTVKRVEFLIDGQRRETLPHGTKVSGTFTRGDINLEAAEPTLSLEGAKSVRLYFPADSGAVIVPVTRVVGAGADINTAVLELAKGPSGDQMLESVVPPGCGLIDVQVENRVAKLNFTGEFVNLVQNSDGGRLALKALVLTCTQFDGIDAVEIYVDGQKYDASQGELGVPSFMNIADSIVYDALQTQSSLLFDMD
ncbi:MAG: GerMN domain-containing protein, partial [Clostridia bacterium]|nr:GerMN domain-containing protein [Clostridia bacterium]